MAPQRFIRLLKMPRRMAGNSDAAASPKAKATTWATNPGGLYPRYPAMRMAAAMANAPRQELGLLADPLGEDALQQVMGDTRRDDQEEPRRGGQGRGDGPRGHQG